MTFHSDFWVATATAAPVIALSAIVSVNETMSQASKDIITNTAVPSSYLKCLNAALWTNLSNIFIQVLVLTFSLQALATDSNEGSPFLTQYLTVIGFILLILSIMLSQMAVRLRGVRSDDKNS